MNRRVFIREGALALLALGWPPAFLHEPLLAHAATGAAGRRRTLICIFQRGAVDGLSMVVPYGERAYYAARRSTAIAPPGQEGGALKLDGFFGLHPSLEPLHALYRERELAVINAVGSPHPTRSHFDAQDYMESATPGVKSTPDGWLNRLLAPSSCECDARGRTLADPARHAVDHAAGQLALATVSHPALRGIAMGPSLPRALRGRQPALAIPDLARFGLPGGDSADEATFRRIYTADGDLVGGRAAEAFEAVRLLRAADPLRYRPAAHVHYPATVFGRALRQIAQLLKSGIGVEVAFADIGGWDTHRGQGGAEGQLARRLAELAQGIRALHDDLDQRMEDVVILTMSEFGRTARENGTGGTDHGHANCMLALGGAVRGGRILGEWPGLEPEQLNEGRDLALTTDFRDVFAELAAGHLGADRLDAVFPGYRIDPARFRGLLA